jgi:protein-arginine kinase activator protein McsA
MNSVKDICRVSCCPICGSDIKHVRQSFLFSCQNCSWKGFDDNLITKIKYTKDQRKSKLLKIEKYEN